MSIKPARDLRAFLQCASCRFSALYFIPFCGGLGAAEALDAPRVLAGAGLWLALTLAIEVTNRLSDRVEDAINRPERTRLCEQLGWERLARARTVLWAVVGAAAVGWLALAPSVLLALALGLGAGAGVGYSCGPRLGRHRTLVFVILSGTFVGPFTLGWVAGAPSAGASLSDCVPLFWVLTLFISSLAGVKDVTDRAGDGAVGYRSAFIQFTEEHGALALTALVSVPFAALVAFAAGGLLPARMLALLAFWPLSIVVALAVRGAGGGAADQLIVRELLYQHWLLFASAAVLARFPSLALLVTVLGAWLCWTLATRHLHWGGGLRAADLRRIAVLALPLRVVRPVQEGA